MRIVKAPFPLYDAIVKAIGKPPPEAIFAWGDTIYNPSGADIPWHLVVHEQVHQMQQRMAGSPERWWDFYLRNPAFRLRQEIQAYGEQYRAISERGANHAQRRRMLAIMADNLSSKMYGSIISRTKAKEAVKAWAQASAMSGFGIEVPVHAPAPRTATQSDGT